MNVSSKTTANETVVCVSIPPIDLYTLAENNPNGIHLSINLDEDEDEDQRIQEAVLHYLLRQIYRKEAPSEEK